MSYDLAFLLWIICSQYSHMKLSQCADVSKQSEAVPLGWNPAVFASSWDTFLMYLDSRQTQCMCTKTALSPPSQYAKKQGNYLCGSELCWDARRGTGLVSKRKEAQHYILQFRTTDKVHSMCSRSALAVPWWKCTRLTILKQEWLWNKCMQ